MRHTHYISHYPSGTFEQWNVGKYPQSNFIRNPFYQYADINYPLMLHTIGETLWCRGVKRRQEKSETTSVEIIRSGSFSFVQNGRRHELKKGDVILLEPLAVREMECLSAEASKTVLIFCGISVKHLINVLSLQNIDVFPSGATAKIQGLYDTAYRLARENTYESLFETSPIIYSILIELASLYAKKQRKQPKALRIAIEYIFQNLKRKPDITELCQITGMSQMSLYRLFNEHLGMPPALYINKARLEYAAELLNENHLSVKEVAAMLDYSSPQYFSSIFKKHFKSSPKKHFQNRSAMPK